MREAVIVNALRTAIGKSGRGALKDSRPDDLTAAVIKKLLADAPQVNPAEIEDVVVGCATPEAQQGMNMARQAALLAGIPDTASAITINRFCSSGLQAIAQAAEHIMVGSADVAIGAGAESMSLLPMGGYNLSPNPTLVDTYPDTYLNMGLTAENLARKYEITREQADEFSVRSHRNAAAAIDGGRFKDEIVPFTVSTRELETDDKGRGKIRVRETVFEVDEGVRRDTTVEGLAKLRPAFHVKGTVTAGNSSQTSDGAAAALDFVAQGQAQVHVRYLGPAPRRYASEQGLAQAPGPVSLRPSAPSPAASVQAVAQGGYFVQVGAFSDRANAEGVREAVAAAGPAIVDTRATAGGELFRVRVGPLASSADAENTRRTLAAIGYDQAVVTTR